MKIEVWSDIICPWCYIGKRRLESALADFDGAVEVEWKSFQLDPEFPRDEAIPVYDALARKFGGGRDQVREMTGRVAALAEVEGLTYDFEHGVMVNTFDAHRLAHHAKSQGLGPEMHERLMRAQLIEGETVNDVDTLVRLAEELGVEGAAVVTSDEYTAEVEADIHEARLLGATGVPFFVLDRKYGVSGAQPVEVFAKALTTAAA